MGGIVCALVAWAFFNFGPALPPFGGTMSDDQIYNEIRNSAVDGTIPNFVITSETDLSRISSEYLHVASDSGVSVEDPTVQTNLYTETRGAMADNGIDVEPLSEEAAEATGLPVGDDPNEP